MTQHGRNRSPARNRPAPDPALVEIARYVTRKNVGGAKAFDNARLCLMDALGCAMQAFAVPECMKLVGPLVPGTVVPHGARVPGTAYQLDPVTAAFSTGCLIRWLDFNDTWWAGGHPSDNFSGILAVADWLSRTRVAAGKPPLTMRDVLPAAIKAYEIHGVLAEGNIFNSPEIGLDLVILLKIASTAVLTQLLGGGVGEITDALSNAFVDGQPLNTYRVMPNCGTAQVVGVGRCHRARGATGAHDHARRNGLPDGALRENLGLLRRAQQGASAAR